MQSTASNHHPDKESAVVAKPLKQLTKPKKTETALGSQNDGPLAVLAANAPAPVLRRAFATYDTLHESPVS